MISMLFGLMDFMELWRVLVNVIDVKQFLKDVPSAKGVQPSRAVNKWRSDIIWKFLNTVAEEIEKIRPGMSVGADVVACLQWSQPKPEKVGFITYDPQTVNLAPNISLALSYVAWRGVTSDMNLQRMRTWKYFNSRPIESLCTEAAICVAMNSKMIAGDIVHSDTVAPDIEAMKTINTVFNYGENIYKKVKGVPSFADIAILSSPENTRKTVNKDWSVRGTSIEGAYQAVLSAGLTAHTLFDDDLHDNFSRYKMLIIPEMSYLGKNAAYAVEEYISKGGKILISGDIPAAIDPYDLDECGDKTLFETLSGNKYNSTLECELSYISPKGTESEKYLKDSPLTSIAVMGDVCLLQPTTKKVNVIYTNTTYDINMVHYLLVKKQLLLVLVLMNTNKEK